MRFHHSMFAFELAPFAFDFLLPRQYFSALARLLRDARGAGQDAGDSRIDVSQLRAVIGQSEFADLIRVRHAAGF